MQLPSRRAVAADPPPMGTLPPARRSVAAWPGLLLQLLVRCWALLQASSSGRSVRASPHGPVLLTTAERVVPGGTPDERLAGIVGWIGGPEGRGRIVPRTPEFGTHQEVRVWQASGEFAVRRISTRRLLGAGLAGTVYEVEDEDGTRYVEKHFGEIPAEGAHRLGRLITAAVFSLFRQAPLSFRERPEAVVAMHLINRVVVAASHRHVDAPRTPALLYSRYDARTGGYVQAFAFVDGRPLRPAATGRPLLGEASVVLPTMRRWRDFLARDLGLWGLARQVDPANVNAFSNVWITPDQQPLLLDLVPGVPGFLEPRYIWWGLRHGQFPPFADAVHVDRLERWVADGPSGRDDLRADLPLLRHSLDLWQASEPRLVASPRRPLELLRDHRVRAATRAALLTHLEVKGAVTADQAHAYRRELAATGTFPARRRHTLLKMAPLALHLALVDRVYAARLVRRLPRVALGVAHAVARLPWRLGRRVSAVAVALAQQLASRALRMRTFLERVGGWVEEERGLGRLSEPEAVAIRREVQDDRETADLAGLFVVHLSISALKHSLLGPSAVWFALALATGRWWLAGPALVAPVLRLLAAVLMGFLRHPRLLVLSAMPDVGVLAVPLVLIARRSLLGLFIVRVLAQKVALGVPAFGVRGGLLEMAAVGGVQLFVIGPFRVLPWAVVAVVLAVLLESWVAALAAVLAYLVAVVWAQLRRPVGAHGLSLPTRAVAFGEPEGSRVA